MWTVLDACLGGLLRPYVQPCVCVCASACACACVHVHVCVCVCVHVCVCMCVCTCVQVLSQRMPPGCQHIRTVMDYLGLGCYSKRETPATGGGGVHIKCIGYLSILVVCSLSCHCVATVWHSEDCVVCCPPQLR